MGAMPGYAEKDPILQKIDYYTQFTPTNEIDQLRQQMDVLNWRKAGNKLAKAIGLTREEKIHLRKWLKNPADWKVANGDKLGELVRRELVKAFEAITKAGGNQEGWPLDCFWVCYPGQTSEAMVKSNPREGDWALGFDIVTPNPDDM